MSQIDLAIEELIQRRIVRRLPNGQLYRASPAEYLLSLEGVPHLRSQVDPMGREIIGHRQVLRRRCPEDVGQTLGIESGRPVTLVKVMWTASGNPAGLTATYLADQVADLAESPAWDMTPASSMSPLMLPPELRADAAAESALRPGGLLIEIQPPPAGAARSLRLAPGQPAVLVVVRFDDPQQHHAAALTIAALRADEFRILIQSPDTLLTTVSAGTPLTP